MTSLATIASRAAPTIDKAAVLDQFEGDRELLREIIVLFLADCPQRLAKLRAAIAAGDCRAVAFAAHSLRGSLSNFAAMRALAVAAHLETLARTGDLTDARAACTALEHEIARLKPVLEHLG